MSRTKRLIFALLTVIVTVHLFVFYSLYVVNGNILMTSNKASSVIGAINTQGGVYMLGRMVPIWGIILVEFIFAYLFEIFVGSPFSFKFASKVFDPKKTNDVVFETTIISATVAIMCPIMSFVASILYYPYYLGFNIFTLFANFLKLLCFNFPFAYFSQLFFIQPFIRMIFKFLYRERK